MKKTLFVLGALAAFALLFTGCPKNSDSPKVVEGSDDNINKDGGEVKLVSAVPEDAVAIFDAFGLTELPSNFTTPGWGYTASLKDDSVYGKTLDFTLTGKAGDYPSASFSFDPAFDVTGKSLYVVIKGNSTLNATDTISDYGDVKFSIGAGETESEVNTLIPHNSNEYAVKSAAISAFWAAYNKTAVSDFSQVDKLNIVLQKADYNFQIAAIYLK